MVTLVTPPPPPISSIHANGLFLGSQHFCRIMAKLNNKQTRFAQEYLVDLNGTQAAIRAGYSPRTANEQASRMLANVNVSNYIAELRSNQQERTQISADMVINELAKIAFSDVSRVFTTDNRLLDVDQMDAKDTAAIASIEVEETTEIDDAGEPFTAGATKKVKLWDKLKALDSLAKHFGLYEKDNKQKEAAAVTIFQLPDNGRDNKGKP